LMRLLSATVRNYRVHRELDVEFDPARTLIGGPNESGKSTLIEAIHRALFLKANVTGEAQASMTRNHVAEHPEVAVRFQAEGAEYQIVKRFSGQTGSARLTQTGGRSWQGEEAQAHLAGLLGVSEAGGGRGILERVGEQWSHLWVWQGAGGESPARHVAAQQAALLQQLQTVGGAVAMQSALDGRVATRFAQAKDEVYSKTGAPLKKSDLAGAQAAAQDAEVARVRAAARLEALRQAVQDYEEASSAIKRAEADLGEVGGRLQKAKEKLGDVERVRLTEERQAGELEGLRLKLDDLEGVEGKISGLRGSIEGTQELLQPLEEGQEQLQSKLEEVRGAKAEAEEACGRAAESAHAIRLRTELAGAFADRFRKETRRSELDTRLGRVRELQRELDEIRGQKAGLVAIDREGLGELQSLENELARASARLSAMSAGVQVVAADQPIRVGGSELVVGQSQTVSDPTEVTVGDGVRLMIYPGGGDSLAEARERMRTLQGELTRALDQYGLESTAKAAEIVALRDELQSRQDSKEAALKEWPEDLPALHKEAEEGLVAARAELERRIEQTPVEAPPSTLGEAEAWLEREAAALEALASEETSLRSLLTVLREKLAGLEGTSSESRDLIQAERQELTGLTAQLKMLLGAYGADEPRVQVLREVKESKAQLEVKLTETRQALEALQPALLEADQERLERAREELGGKKQQAERTQIESQTLLRSDGTDDPCAALSQAEAAVEAAREHLSLVERKARALSLVDQLFQEQQQALTDRFSQPLAQRISAYLQCLFGPEAQAKVVFEKNAFAGVRLVRGAEAGEESFESLSGGAQEQVAAAVRLAIAELLAADHDGTLPIVLDDAFAYSDPERVVTLQRMLDLGASRGLQVIVLTCNPSDYASLGAREIVLKKPVIP
jgi:DNA repair exonuclease SbcCD ATPase subunit